MSSLFRTSNEKKAAPTTTTTSVATKTRKVRGADTNVIFLDLSNLGDSKAVAMATGDTIDCAQCGAVLSSLSVIKKQHWTCEFCSHQNAIECDDDDELPHDANLQYLINPAPPANASNTIDEAGVVVFVVDVSGSMCVSNQLPAGFGLWQTQVNGEGGAAAVAKQRKELQTALGLSDEDMRHQHMRGEARDRDYVARLQCVQAAINMQMTEMHKSKPNTRVVLLTFANEVLIYGDGAHDPITITGLLLNDKAALLAKGAAVDVGKLQSLSKSKQALVDRVCALTESGQTAAGPALLVALGIAQQRKRSEIIFCTDGMANVGVGSLDVDRKAASTRFYSDVAAQARSNSTLISVVAIEGGDLALHELSLLADGTGGAMNIVKPFEVQRRFRALIDSPTLATEVRVTAHVSKGFRFVSDDKSNVALSSANASTSSTTSTTSSKKKSKKSSDDSKKSTNEQTLELNVGNVNKYSDLVLRFEPTSTNEEANDDESNTKALLDAHFQIVIHYKQTDGAELVRVLSAKRAVSSSRDDVEQDVDVSVIAVATLRRAVALAYALDFDGARDELLAVQKLFDRVATTDAQQEEYDIYVDDFADKLDRQLASLQTSKATKLDDATIALLHSLKSASRTTMLAGSRKKDIVKKQKAHIGELKSLL